MKPIKRGKEGGTFDIYDIFGDLTSRLYTIINAENTELINVSKEEIFNTILIYFSSYNPQEVIEEISYVYSKIEEIRSLMNDGKLEILVSKSFYELDKYFDDSTPSDEKKIREKYILEIAEEIDYYEQELKKIEVFIERKHSLSIIDKRYVWNGSNTDIVELGYALLENNAIKNADKLNKEDSVRYLGNVLNHLLPINIRNIKKEINARTTLSPKAFLEKLADCSK